MFNKKALGAAALTASLAAGGVVGALFGTPISSAAQESTDEPTATAPAGEDAERLRHRHHGRHPGFHRGVKGAALEVAAEAIGISEDDLRAALREGNSIAAVAEENGVDVQAVVDALVAHANERIDAMQQTLPDRFTELVNREGGRHRGGPGFGAESPEVGASDA